MVDEPTARASLECSVERIIHVRPDGYTVARVVSAAGDGAEVTTAGRALAGIQPGETLLISGDWLEHPKYGRRFDAVGFTTLAPSSVRAIRLYLSSGLVRGIGAKLATAIVERFGTDTLRVIDTEPERLLEVTLIGPGRRDQIVGSWIQQQAIRELMVLLRGFGVSPALAVKIYQEFGDGSANLVRKDPYRLVGEVRGIAFATADKIALASGVPEDSPERCRAALLDRLDAAAATGGHCFLPEADLVRQAVTLVAQDERLIQEALDDLAEQRSVIREPLEPDSSRQAVFRKRLWDREHRLASALTRLASVASDMPTAVLKRLDAILAAADGRHGTDPANVTDGQGEGAGRRTGDALHPDQAAAVRMALTNTVSVLTGGPGCGKSRTVKTIAEAVRAGGGRVTLSAPTGKAARRLSELTGIPAMTVHRLVADRQDDHADADALFTDSPLMADLIVVDESSMLDVHLAANLAKKVIPGCHLLLVGDEDQLPSIGPGRVLADLLRTPQIPHTRLQHVFRQAEGSSITTNARLIREGRPPVLKAPPGFWFEECGDPAAVADRVLEIATTLIPAKHGVDPDQVQVLCPSRKGRTGTVELGRRIQERLNPAAEGKAEHWAGPTVFRVGDKVMQIRNDPYKGAGGVFNGTTGTVTGVDHEERILTVQTDGADGGEELDYDFDELDDLLHAYAVSVHRSQGSEFPFVVAPITTESAALLLRRALIYTLVTRAAQTVILVGQRDALRMAVERPGQPRNTMLTRRLTGVLDPAA